MKISREWLTPIDKSVFARFSLSAYVAPMELGRGPLGEL
jgi:hypothetical protein